MKATKSIFGYDTNDIALKGIVIARKVRNTLYYGNEVKSGSTLVEKILDLYK